VARANRAWPELLGSAEEVAPRLLGAVLRHGPVSVRLTEVEAYAGPADPGSHAFRGPTPRTQVMFGPPGHLYCYFSYGMHVCANIVVGPEGTASAVLLRAGEVIAGIEQARARRATARDRDLARGPARLCRALGLDLAHGGLPIGRPRSRAEVTLSIPAGQSAYDHGPRVGLRRAPDRPWRFWIPGEAAVSDYRRHPRAEPEGPPDLNPANGVL